MLERVVLPIGPDVEPELEFCRSAARTVGSIGGDASFPGAAGAPEARVDV